MEPTREEIFIKMVMDAWFAKLEKANQLFNALSDEDLQKEVAPGRSRGVYLLGHLAAVHDRMLPILGFGEAMYPELYDTFVTKPDRAVADIPSVQYLRECWKKVNETLTTRFKSTSGNELFQKHNSVSEDDFAKEPHRNKLNLVINRTNHLDNHLGQLVFLRKKE
jgi:hypothetical protein